MCGKRVWLIETSYTALIGHGCFSVMAAICDLLYTLLTVVHRKRHSLVVCIYVHVRLQIIVYMPVTYYFVLLFIQFKVIWGHKINLKMVYVLVPADFIIAHLLHGLQVLHFSSALLARKLSETMLPKHKNTISLFACVHI